MCQRVSRWTTVRLAAGLGDQQGARAASPTGRCRAGSRRRAGRRRPTPARASPVRRGGAARSASSSPWAVLAHARLDQAVLAQEDGDVGLLQRSTCADARAARRSRTRPGRGPRCAARGRQSTAAAPGRARPRGRRRCTSSRCRRRTRPCRRCRRSTSGGRARRAVGALLADDRVVGAVRPAGPRPRPPRPCASASVTRSALTLLARARNGPSRAALGRLGGRLRRDNRD